ncbi:GDSL-type esterase/lipase family protein [uncultured Ruminococcus sp.]|uniref:GDSL-type esterase/lipase family protein n=1 Tax=uncultured Ruminococcus sp. TaxID=165186 RepID=UPI00265DEEF0|nr:GDSL-type esterase/lipase family protein [uncultured Ruminococcus sp.]
MNRKKWIALPTAALLLFGGIVPVSAADAELQSLQTALLGASELSQMDDVDGDGIVNGFDLCLLRSMQQTTGELTQQHYAATSESVKLTGRTMRSNDTTWLVQSGSAVSFTVTGTSASVTLAGDSSIQNEADYRPRYAVLVDGEIVADEVMSSAEKTMTLFEGEVIRTAKIQIIHLSEAMNGAVGVKDISAVSDRSDAVIPEKEKALSIEFIGDSITCAYGVEGSNSYEPFRTTTENFMKSYAYLTAQKLDADYSAVSYSGYGVLSGYTSGDINTDSLIPDCYGLIGKLPDYAKPWDFDTHSYDVVVVNLGTNDSSYVSKDAEARTPAFISAYVEFLKTLREKNPSAYLICTLGTMGGDLYPSVENAVEQYRTETGDQRIMSYESTLQNQADGIGSDWHPSAVTQQKSAYVLADKICQALGMESDQIGLDMAADAEYRLNIAAEKGGNAASYVGYDKSFWINMVTGGETPDAIEAEIAGVPLKNGGSYRLEFDCTSGYDGMLPVQVCGADGSIYFSSKFDAVSEKTHFSAKFTAEQDDAAASIIFQLGGKDSYNVTLSNISLVKIS